MHGTVNAPSCREVNPDGKANSEQVPAIQYFNIKCIAITLALSRLKCILNSLPINTDARRHHVRLSASGVFSPVKLVKAIIMTEFRNHSAALQRCLVT